jgi:Na+/proline symporter
MLILAVAAYVLVQLAIGWWAARRTRTESDYFVAGRSLGLFAVTLSLFATWFGAETVMGSSAAIAEGGLAEARAEPFGYFFALVLMGVLVAAKLRDGGHVTLADFYRQRFGPRTETWMVVANVPSSIVWAAAQLTALGLVMHAVSGVPVGLTLGFAAVLVIAYTTAGGLMGDVVSDMIQGVILLIGMAILLVFVVAKAGGPAEALALIEPKSLNLLGSGESWLARTDAWAIPIFGSLVTSEAAARFLGSKTAKVARRAAFAAAGLYLVAGLIPVLTGLIGARLGLATGQGDLFLPGLAKALLPPALLVILMGALLSAILSTVDSNILAASSLLTHNGVDRLLPNLGDAQRLWIARGATIGAGLLAWLVAAGGQRIYDLIEFTSVWGTSGTLVAFLFGAWATGFGDGRAASASIAAGVAVNLATTFVVPALGYEIEGGFLLALVVSLAVYVGAALILRRRPAPAAA